MMSPSYFRAEDNCMPTKVFKGRELISDKFIRKKYKLTRAELWQLIYDAKLNPLIEPTTIYFNRDAVERFFELQKNNEAAPITISAHDIIVKFNLTRVEFAKLLGENKLVPLPLECEQNLHFEYRAVCKYFNNQQ